MTQPPSAPAAANRPSAPPSDRVRLARLALDAALSLDGVESGTDGPLKLWVTVDQGQRLPGVVAAVLPDGRHQVTLHLVAEPVPLHPLADDIRDRITADAGVAGLDELLGPVDISFDDLADPTRPAQPPPPAPPPPAGRPAASPPGGAPSSKAARSYPEGGVGA